MMSKHLSIKVLIFIALLAPLPSWAEKNEKQVDRYKCQLISRAEAISRARKRVDGKIVGVQLDKNDSKSVYRVRVLVNKKRVRTLSISACK
jgi:uncharacterized membrane protein YkoI